MSLVLLGCALLGSVPRASADDPLCPPRTGNPLETDHLKQLQLVSKQVGATYLDDGSCDGGSEEVVREAMRCLERKDAGFTSVTAPTRMSRGAWQCLKDASGSDPEAARRAYTLAMRNYFRRMDSRLGDIQQKLTEGVLLTAEEEKFLAEVNSLRRQNDLNNKRKARPPIEDQLRARMANLATSPEVKAFYAKHGVKSTAGGLDFSGFNFSMVTKAGSAESRILEKLYGAGVVQAVRDVYDRRKPPAAVIVGTSVLIPNRLQLGQKAVKPKVLSFEEYKKKVKNGFAAIKSHLEMELEAAKTYNQGYGGVGADPDKMAEQTADLTQSSLGPYKILKDQLGIPSADLKQVMKARFEAGETTRKLIADTVTKIEGVEDTTRGLLVDLALVAAGGYGAAKLAARGASLVSKARAIRTAANVNNALQAMKTARRLELAGKIFSFGARALDVRAAITSVAMSSGIRVAVSTAEWYTSNPREFGDPKFYCGLANNILEGQIDYFKNSPKDLLMGYAFKGAFDGLRLSGKLVAARKLQYADELAEGVGQYVSTIGSAIWSLKGSAEGVQSAIAIRKSLDQLETKCAELSGAAARECGVELKQLRGQFLEAIAGSVDLSPLVIKWKFVSRAPDGHLTSTYVNLKDVSAGTMRSLNEILPGGPHPSVEHSLATPPGISRPMDPPKSSIELADGRKVVIEDSKPGSSEKRADTPPAQPEEARTGATPPSGRTSGRIEIEPAKLGTPAVLPESYAQSSRTELEVERKRLTELGRPDQPQAKNASEREILLKESDRARSLAAHLDQMAAGMESKGKGNFNKQSVANIRAEAERARKAADGLDRRAGGRDPEKAIAQVPKPDEILAAPKEDPNGTRAAGGSPRDPVTGPSRVPGGLSQPIPAATLGRPTIETSALPKASRTQLEVERKRLTELGRPDQPQARNTAERETLLLESDRAKAVAERLDAIAAEMTARGQGKYNAQSVANVRAEAKRARDAAKNLERRAGGARVSTDPPVLEAAQPPKQRVDRPEAQPEVKAETESYVAPKFDPNVIRPEDRYWLVNPEQKSSLPTGTRVDARMQAIGDARSLAIGVDQTIRSARGDDGGAELDRDARVQAMSGAAQEARIRADQLDGISSRLGKDTPEGKSVAAEAERLRRESKQLSQESDRLRRVDPLSFRSMFATARIKRESGVIQPDVKRAREALNRWESDPRGIDARALDAHQAQLRKEADLQASLAQEILDRAQRQNPNLSAQDALSKSNLSREYTEAKTRSTQARLDAERAQKLRASPDYQRVALGVEVVSGIPQKSRSELTELSRKTSEKASNAWKEYDRIGELPASDRKASSEAMIASYRDAAEGYRQQAEWMKKHAPNEAGSKAAEQLLRQAALYDHYADAAARRWQPRSESRGPQKAYELKYFQDDFQRVRNQAYVNRTEDQKARIELRELDLKLERGEITAEARDTRARELEAVHDERREAFEALTSNAVSAAHRHLGSEVATTRRTNQNGLEELLISTEGSSNLNRFAAGIKRRFGVDLVFTPGELAESKAAGFYDHTHRRFALSAEAVEQLRAGNTEAHEAIHALLFARGSEGSQDFLNGYLNAKNGKTLIGGDKDTNADGSPRTPAANQHYESYAHNQEVRTFSSDLSRAAQRMMDPSKARAERTSAIDTIEWKTGTLSNNLRQMQANYGSVFSRANELSSAEFVGRLQLKTDSGGGTASMSLDDSWVSMKVDPATLARIQRSQKLSEELTALKSSGSDANTIRLKEEELLQVSSEARNSFLEPMVTERELAGRLLTRLERIKKLSSELEGADLDSQAARSKSTELKKLIDENQKDILKLEREDRIRISRERENRERKTHPSDRAIQRIVDADEANQLRMDEIRDRYLPTDIQALERERGMAWQRIPVGEREAVLRLVAESKAVGLDLASEYRKRAELERKYPSGAGSQERIDSLLKNAELAEKNALSRDRFAKTLEDQWSGKNGWLPGFGPDNPDGSKPIPVRDGEKPAVLGGGLTLGQSRLGAGSAPNPAALPPSLSPARGDEGGPFPDPVALPKPTQPPTGSPVIEMVTGAMLKKMRPDLGPIEVSSTYRDTRLFTPRQIGYDGYGVRPAAGADSIRAHRSVTSVQELPSVNVPKVHALQLAGDSVGQNSRVLVGQLDGGRMVAIKSKASGNEADLLVEAKSMQLLSDLGIGPRFYGIYRHPEIKQPFLVMDVLHGGFDGPTTAKTLADADQVVKAFRDHQVNYDPSRLSFYRSKDGRLSAVDNEEFANGYDPSKYDPAQAEAAYAHFRAKMLEGASTDMRSQYLGRLMREDPAGYRILAEVLEKQQPAKPGQPRRKAPAPEESAAVASLPDLSRYTRSELDPFLKSQGFWPVMRSSSGNNMYMHSDGSEVFIRTDGRIVRRTSRLRPPVERPTERLRDTPAQ